jgi:plastocyanin
VIASLAASLALLAGPTAGLPPATPVGMSAREYSFGVYRTRVPSGRVRLNVHNYGEDAHDLQVRGAHGYRSAVSPEIAPGATLSFTVRLRRPGRYLFICLRPGHAARGMTSHITVRKRRS